MKRSLFHLLALALLAMTSCGKDDGPGTEKPPVVEPPSATLPTVELPAADGCIEAITGRSNIIVPTVGNGAGAAYRWLLDGREVSDEPAYTFREERLGDYELVLIVTNDGGQGRADAIVRVKEVPAISISFESASINAPAGRAVVIAPCYSYASASTTYQWQVDGVVQAEEGGETFRFTPSAACTVTVTATENGQPASQSIAVEPTAAEGTYRRAAAQGSSARSNKVYEFLPAPGQFVNEGYSAATQAQANAYAEGQLTGGGMVSLGSFGGYIVAGFDHSVANTAGADLAIRGNAFTGSSEPGIVWVMQDENGDGLPNDTWYELAGSETGKPETRQRYAMTYFKPSGAHRSVRWIDNDGNSGAVEANSFHQQDYYPSWVGRASYTLRGTNLASQTVDQSGIWVHGAFEWGYADNYGSDYTGGEALLELDNAVYPDGTPVALQYIDFVKVQAGLNVMAGALGENSTDILGFRDINF